MFDMGFLELLVIGIIALIVLGPERLPKAARTVGLWIAKAKQGFESVKSEIDRELKVQELQQQIKSQKEQLEQDAGIADLKNSFNETQNILEENSNSILNETNSITNQVTGSDSVAENEIDENLSNSNQVEPNTEQSTSLSKD